MSKLATVFTITTHSNNFLSLKTQKSHQKKNINRDIELVFIAANENEQEQAAQLAFQELQEPLPLQQIRKFRRPLSLCLYLQTKRLQLMGKLLSLGVSLAQKLQLKQLYRFLY